MKYPYEFAKELKVYDCALTKVRIGNEHDGGYVVLKEICEKTPMVYAFGVGNDVGFEMDWIKKYPKSKVKLFDPFIDRLPQEHNRFSFHRFGLGLNLKPIKDVIPDSLLKLDIEWDEWGALHVFDDEELEKFSQLVIEFHIFHVEPRIDLSSYFTMVYGEFCDKINEDLFLSYLQTFQRLRNWFVIHHVHANNSLPVINVDGIKIPPLLEVSFVRRNLIKGIKETKSQFPIEGLDMPNKTNRADILDYYPFVNGRTIQRAK